MTASTSQQARNFSKMRKASHEFSKVSAYGDSLVVRLSRHCNGNLNEPYRKLHKFVEHNSAPELVQIARMSEVAIQLESVDGRKRNVCHLVPVSRASQISKVNNASNLAVLLEETNRIIHKRSISRVDAEALDRMVLAGNYLIARAFADKRCF